jgi:DNA-directed RNA polymerase specialized sigma24 family protein
MIASKRKTIVHLDRDLRSRHSMRSSDSKATNKNRKGKQRELVLSNECSIKDSRFRDGQIKKSRLGSNVCIQVEGSSGKGKASLSKEAFNNLLEYLHPDRECAGHVYESLRRKLIMFFESRGCHSPVEYADETINRVAYNIQQSRQIWTDLPRYFLGVARNLLKEFWREKERWFLPIELIPPQLHPSMSLRDKVEKDSELEKGEQRLECLTQCMEELSSESRDLLLRYYQGEKGQMITNRKILAEEMGIPVASLRLRAFRLRHNLEFRFNEIIKGVKS